MTSETSPFDKAESSFLQLGCLVMDDPAEIPTFVFNLTVVLGILLHQIVKLASVFRLL